jgi:hypothetical protein
MALTLFDVLKHLVIYGPARNPTEVEMLTEAIDAAEAEATSPASPAQTVKEVQA